MMVDWKEGTICNWTRLEFKSINIVLSHVLRVPWAPYTQIVMRTGSTEIHFTH